MSKKSRRYDEDFGWNILGWMVERAFPYMLLGLVSVAVLAIIMLVVSIMKST